MTPISKALDAIEDAEQGLAFVKKTSRWWLMCGAVMLVATVAFSFATALAGPSPCVDGKQDPSLWIIPAIFVGLATIAAFGLGLFIRLYDGKTMADELRYARRRHRDLVC